MKLTPKEILEGAQKAIIEKGWCQGTLRAEDGSICLMGSMVWSRFVSQEAFERAQKAVLTHTDNMSIPAWNDTPGRSVEDVLLVLKWAAKEFE